MQITFTQPTFIGTRTYAKGEAANLSDQQAQNLINSDRAVPAKAVPQIETATAPAQPTETADALPKVRGK